MQQYDNFNLFKGTAHFAQFQQKPIGGSSEKPNKKILKKKIEEN